MYQLTSEVYLDKRNECYKKIIVITPDPQKDPSAVALQCITSRVHREKLSPFKDRTTCCSIEQCMIVLCKPNTNELLCLKDIPILFNYLIKNGYQINTDITKVMHKTKIKDLICYISKN